MLCYIRLYYIISYYVILYYIVIYYMILYHIMSYFISFYYIILYHIMLYHITLHYAISYYTTVHHIILHYITQYYIIVIIWVYTMLSYIISYLSYQIVLQDIRQISKFTFSYATVRAIHIIEWCKNWINKKVNEWRDKQPEKLTIKIKNKKTNK